MLGTALLSFAFAALPLTAQAKNYHGQPQRIKKRADWKLAQKHQGSNFFDGWNFFTAGDPTHGLVDYKKHDDLAFVDDQGKAIMRVDNKADLAENTPRRSIRIESKEPVNQGSLTIMHASHFPYGCAVWPAWWMYGPDWPNNGEIDIWEGVNQIEKNAMTLHTRPGCTHDPAATQTGTSEQLDCDVNVNGNVGCPTVDPRTESYGDELNAANGGAYATLWDESGIKIWFFTAANVPSDMKNGDSPNPDGWGTPAASFPFTTCSTDFFKNLNLVFDITLCGDWAGAVFEQTCSGSCAATVAKGSNFDNAYFKVDFVKVFTR